MTINEELIIIRDVQNANFDLEGCYIHVPEYARDQYRFQVDYHRKPIRGNGILHSYQVLVTENRSGTDWVKKIGFGAMAEELTHDWAEIVEDEE